MILPRTYVSKKRVRFLALLLLLFLPGRLVDPTYELFPSEQVMSEPTMEWLLKNYPTLLTPSQLQKLYETLIKGYWVPQTGLFLSFPGTGDLRLVQQAATYDQGIVGVLLLKLGDVDKVRLMVRFYEKAWEASGERSGPRAGRRGLANFYNAYYGVEGVEKTMHVGPNAWIGLVASRYYRQTGDSRGLWLALEIAHWIHEKIPHLHGAVAMGEIPWNWGPWPKIFSTENNLSTYAFFTDLLNNRGLSRSDRSMLEKERQAIRGWLVQGAYDPQSGQVIRGFNPEGLDRVGAIDSYTWYISTLRPEYLRSQSIPIDHLMRLAAQDFSVKIGDRLGIDCVDGQMAMNTYNDEVVKNVQDIMFLRPKDYGHRLIWYEGQGQYSVTLQDMARDSVIRAFAQSNIEEREKLLIQAAHWFERADLFIRQMDEASFKLPWGQTYPCATQGRFYLWGWPAPGPSSNHPSDAVAPLVWRMFGGMGYESMTNTQINPTQPWTIRPIVWKASRDPGTELLYGASEEMVVRAWDLYDEKNNDKSWRQAQATIKLWENDARILEKLKEKQVGTYLPYKGDVDELQQIHNYWALNDVAAAYFIMGKIADDQKNYAEARHAFETILKEYPLAQLWDKRGWFWNPVATIQSEFAESRPQEYGALLPLIPEFPPFTPAEVASKAASAHS